MGGDKSSSSCNEDVLWFVRRCHILVTVLPDAAAKASVSTGLDTLHIFMKTILYFMTNQMSVCIYDSHLDMGNRLTGR
jgi:hypothetical protein